MWLCVLEWGLIVWLCVSERGCVSISIIFYLYSAVNKGALSQSRFTENRPQRVSLG